MNHPYVIAVTEATPSDRPMSEAEREQQGEQVNVGIANRLGLRALLSRWLHRDAPSHKQAEQAPATDLTIEQAQAH